jgi:hypothetical protein
VADVLHRPRREVVEDVDPMAPAQQLVGEVGSDESGSARDRAA